MPTPLRESCLALLRGLLPALRRHLALDYSLVPFYMRYAAVLGSLGYLAFHFVEAGMGYRDYWPLRIACILAPLPLLFLSRSGRLSRAGAFYWEFTGWLLMPVAQTFLLLLNRPDAYWSSSISMVGLFLGLLSQPAWLPLHFLTGPAAGIGLYALLMGPPEAGTLAAYWGMLSTAFITALLSLSVQVGMLVFHRRGIELTEVKARALEARRREEEIRAAYAELEKREKVITRFVRPSLFAELTRGQDPTEFEPVVKDLAVLFCDIREFTSLTEVLAPRERQEFLNRYFSMMTRPIVGSGGEVDKIMGDCVMGIFPDGAAAVKAVGEMRRELQEFNREMFERGSPKIRNGIGVAKGPVMLGNFGSFEKLDRTVIGEAVNIASRLESKTKMYNLEVVVTEDVIRDLPPGTPHYRWIDLVKVKGSTRSLRLYEIYAHQPEEVRRYKDDTRELLEKALTIYFRKGFRDANRLFRAMLSQVPPHRHTPTRPMDTLLQYYIDHCEAWINDSHGSLEKVERWDGVHAFHEK